MYTYNRSGRGKQVGFQGEVGVGRKLVPFMQLAAQFTLLKTSQSEAHQLPTGQ